MKSHNLEGKKEEKEGKLGRYFERRHVGPFRMKTQDFGRITTSRTIDSC
jgi:hypothetical protein